MVFDDLYRKTQATEKDCPSSSVKSKKERQQQLDSSSVVTESLLCGKVCGVFSINSIITVVDGQRELNAIFSNNKSFTQELVHN